MSICYKPCFVSTIMFNIKDKMYTDLLISSGYLSTFTKILECVIVIKLYVSVGDTLTYTMMVTNTRD